MHNRTPFRALSRPRQALIVLALAGGLAFTFGLAWAPYLYAAFAAR